MYSGKITVSFHSDGSQKCRIPHCMLSSVNAEAGQFVIIKCAKAAVICKICCQTSPVTYVQADDTVCVNTQSDVPYNYADFPNDFKFCTTTPLRNVRVRAIFSDINCLIKWNKIDELKKLIKGALCRYAVAKGCSVKLVGHTVGSLCGIQQIEILNTYEDDDVVGQITPSTVLELDGVTSSMQMKQQENLRDLKIGGINYVLDALKSVIRTRRRKNGNYFSKILVTGPPGCGKTILIKKIAYDFNCYLHIVRLAELVQVQSCKILFNFVMRVSKLDSVQFVILLKNLDMGFGSTKDEKKVLYMVLALLDLVSDLENVTVFGTASSSRHLAQELRTSGRFTKEICIGVPNTAQREEILKVLTADFKCEADVTEVARMSPGYIGADLAQLCAEAQRSARDDCAVENEETDRTVTTSDFKAALSVVKPSLLRDSKFRLDVQPVHWEDIGGMDAIKKRMKLYVEWPLLHPHEFAKVGIPCPHGVLLFGPPGCCKTTLVRVVATECKATFLAASPAQIYSCFVGDSEKSIIELFHQARLCAPSIIFLDEIDSLVGKRAYSSNHRGIQEKVLSVLLNEMDGIGVVSESFQEPRRLLENEAIEKTEGTCEMKSNENVLVVAATNRIDLIDDALLRPGRFDSILYVPPPNTEEREAILKTLMAKVASKDIDVKLLAEETDLFSGADLKNLVRIAVLSAFKSSSQVAMEHFASALKLVHPSITRKQLHEYELMASRYGPLIAN